MLTGAECIICNGPLKKSQTFAKLALFRRSRETYSCFIHKKCAPPAVNSSMAWVTKLCRRTQRARRRQAA